ncbi:protein atonal homolog 8 isoform X2 [Cephus cinctus]|nr:protein atonal homolog 8 isoform X2 [Cephus cinctus]
MAGSERDAGFCSGGDEDDMSGLHSPSASEDSVEVQVTPISLRNKRKLAEPRKIQEPSTAPLKKRRFEVVEETTSIDEESRPAGSPSPSPFRPWSTSASKSSETKTSVAPKSIESDSQDRVNHQRRHESRLQEEAARQRLQDNDQRPESPLMTCLQRPGQNFQPPAPPVLPHPRLQDEPLSLVLRGEDPRVPSHPGVSGTFDRAGYPLDNVMSHSLGQGQHHHHHRSQSPNGHSRHQAAGGQQRNYKNMTRERRIEANARERTRVHTISAAFDTLRRAIPAYSHNQKLSKLSVLRIACSYIMTLSKIANTPEGESANGTSLGACVDLVSRTIQTEGKLRKKKDE